MPYPSRPNGDRPETLPRMKLVLRPIIVLALIALALAISWFPWRDQDTDTGAVSAPPEPPPVAQPPTTPPRPDPTPGPMPSGDQALADQVVALVNAERAKARCGAVRPDARLTGAALAHSADMARRGYLSHDGLDGLDPWERARAAGYPSLTGENIAVGYPDAKTVMSGWVASKAHRAPIVNCPARSIGVGIARTRTGTPYWTQLLGS